MSRNNRNNSQEVLLFNEPLALPYGFSLNRAKQAANRRHKRIGNVARVAGFKRRTNGLFVPHSGTENSAVVDIPENKARLEKDSAKQRVYEKYEGNDDVSTKQVNLWAYFASQKAHSAIRHKYRRFRDESITNAARIGVVLRPLGGVIARDAFTFDPDYRMDPESHKARDDVLAYNSVLKYYVDLEAFVGENPDVIGNRGQRKWPQYRHEHAYRERLERAHESLQPLADDLFAERVDEAYWSHFSRNRFWVGAINQYEEFKREERRQFNIRAGNEAPPPEYYESLIQSEAELSPR